jgi:hypothetical protein
LTGFNECTQRLCLYETCSMAAGFAAAYSTAAVAAAGSTATLDKSFLRGTNGYTEVAFPVHLERFEVSLHR